MKQNTVRQLQRISSSSCSEEIQQGSPGLGSVATPIQFWDELPLVAKAANQTKQPHPPCIPNYLSAAVTGTYTSVVPSYPKGGPVVAWTATTRELYWNGCNRDRPDAGPVGTLLIVLVTNQAVTLASQVVCKIKRGAKKFAIPLTGKVITVPSFVKVLCQTVLAILEGIQMGFQTAFQQTQSQLRWVNSAEIRAGYGNSRNLLSKQCATFDQVICRPVEKLGIGSGCDGIDSNCNDEIDECDEDIIPPMIDVTTAIDFCGSGQNTRFQSIEDAEKCVSNTIEVKDDCQEIQSREVSSSGTCADATIDVRAVDTCGNGSPISSIPVQVDGTAPEVSCAFNAGTALANLTSVNYLDNEGMGAMMGRFQNVGLAYHVEDNCGMPVRVTTEIYSNEIDTRRPNNMAFFIDKTNMVGGALSSSVAESSVSMQDLYLQIDACGMRGASGRECVGDPTIDTVPGQEIRLYTARITATDQGGNSGIATCGLAIVDRLPSSASDDDDDDHQELIVGLATTSTQRFLVASTQNLVYIH